MIWYWAANKRARDASLDYLGKLERATGAIGRVPGRRETLRHFLSFAETILDKMLALGGRYRFDRIRFVGREAIDGMVRARQGGLLVTAHMGCLEMCQASAESVPGLKLTVLVHTVNAERFNRMLERLSPGREISLLQVTEITPATAVMLAERVEGVASSSRSRVIASRSSPARASAVQIRFSAASRRFLPAPTCWPRCSSARCIRWSASARALDTHEVVFERLAERVVLPRADRQGRLPGPCGDRVRAADRTHAGARALRVVQLLFLLGSTRGPGGSDFARAP